MTISARWLIFSYPTLMQPVRALQSTGKSKACFTWHYAFVKNSLMLLGIAIMILAGLELIYIGIVWASFLLIPVGFIMAVIGFFSKDS